MRITWRTISNLSLFGRLGFRNRAIVRGFWGSWVLLAYIRKKSRIYICINLYFYTSDCFTVKLEVDKGSNEGGLKKNWFEPKDSSKQQREIIRVTESWASCLAPAEPTNLRTHESQNPRIAEPAKMLLSGTTWKFLERGERVNLPERKKTKSQRWGEMSDCY